MVSAGVQTCGRGRAAASSSGHRPGFDAISPPRTAAFSAARSVAWMRRSVAAPAGLAARLLARHAVGTCERHPSGQPLTPADIAIGVTHRDQADQIRQALAQATPAAAKIRVDTANRLQGAEFEITIILHPLSGRHDATAFHLEAGRLCVLASRHRHACIIVARAGIADLLDAHPSDEPIHLGVPAKFPDGWEAHQSLLAHLSAYRIKG